MSLTVAYILNYTKCEYMTQLEGHINISYNPIHALEQFITFILYYFLIGFTKHSTKEKRVALQLNLCNIIIAPNYQIVQFTQFGTRQIDAISRT